MPNSITITGVDELIAKLGKAASNDILTQPMNDAVNTIKAEAMKYPPPIAGSSYVRTDTLKNRWADPNNTHIRKNGNGLVGTIGNNTEYGPFVMSHLFQARIHEGRWRTDREILERNRAAIVADFQQAIAKALK